MLGRRPLLPAKDYLGQLRLIVATLGKPSEEDMAFISNSRARAWVRALPPSQVRACTCVCIYARACF